MWTFLSLIFQGIVGSPSMIPPSDTKPHIDYKLSYIATGNNASSSMIFSTANNESHILMKHDSMTKCQDHCANLSNSACASFLASSIFFSRSPSNDLKASTAL